MIGIFFNTEIVSEQNSRLESFANVCFTPIRYLFEGRTLTVFDQNQGNITEELFPSNQNWKKTALAVIALVPCALIGSVAKLISYCFASARENYQIAKNQDIFNLDLIYSTKPGGFHYSVSRHHLEGLLSKYNPEQQQLIKEDIRNIYRSVLREQPKRSSLATITAGAPGAGKTTLLTHYRQTRGTGMAYTCPDDFLKRMSKTYQADIQRAVLSSVPEEARRQRLDAYNKWRAASQLANELVLAHLIRQKYSFCFGSALSSPFSSNLLELLKRHDYTIKLLHVTARDGVRWASIQERDKTFVQTTEEDIREKGKLVPQRIMDTYLRFANEIEFYYRRDVHESAQLAAVWTRKGQRASASKRASTREFSEEKSPSNNRMGVLRTVSPHSLDQIKEIHDSEVGSNDLSWKATVEQNSDPVES